jgi:hypothetical protein
MRKAIEMSPNRTGFALACMALALTWAQTSGAARKAPRAEGAKKLRATKKAPATWTWDEQADKSVALKRGEQVVWRFNYAADQNKAYFHPVALPGGPVLTWDKPPDHVWHHALWFSWKFLNGVNYWEIDRKTGKPAGRSQWANVKVATRPDHSARISMDMTWRDPDDKAVLTGTRTVDVSAPDETGRYHFDWTCTFTAGKKDVLLDRTPLPGEPGGKGYGGYAGLSLRLAKDLIDRKAVTPTGPVKFEQDRYRDKAPAMDYNGTIGGKAVGVAVCDHADNLNHPTPWYAIASKKMSYYSPAVICYKPHTITAGKTLTLRYRVIVHADRWDAKTLKTECHRFATESAADKPKMSTP